MQRALGYSLSGETQYECMFILWGKLTRNGKGTLCESIMRIMGVYGRSVSPESLAHKPNFMGSSANEDIARLAGIRFANISEPSKSLVLNAAMVKAMTGNDSLPARFLYENTFEFYPRFKMYINANHRPIVNDPTLFTSNRVYNIPFERHFEEGEQDKTLKATFQKPGNQSGILNWLIEGYKNLKARGLDPSQAVRDAVSEYHHDSDKVGQFFEEVMIPDPNGEVRTAAVYKEYQSWCRRSGVRYESNPNFNQAMRVIGSVVKKRPRDGGSVTTMLVGYTLPSDDFEQQSLFDMAYA